MRQAARSAETPGKTRSGPAHTLVPSEPAPHPGLSAAPALNAAALGFGERTAPGGGAQRQTLARMQQTQGNQAVLRMLASSTRRGDRLYRKCSCGGSGGECAECSAGQGAAIDRAAVDRSRVDGVPSIIHDVLREPGQPIDPETRAFMEPRFGQDFGNVRIHDDSRAAESAAAVNAVAYTVGRHIVFGAGQYSSAKSTGRSLIAHELAHVAQQGGGDGAAPQVVSDPGDASEREADAAAEAVMRAAAPADSGRPIAGSNSNLLAKLQPKLTTNSTVLQRKIVVDPAGEAGFILGELNTLCPGKLSVAGDTISSNCEATTNQSCDCACDAAADPARTYTVHVQPAAGRSTTQTLWDGSTEVVPDSTLWPNTYGGNDPNIYVESGASTIEFGFFKDDGTASWYQHWRILAHELCGHGRLGQTYSGGTGNRPGHDVTIDTENAIAAEHGQVARGHFADRRQGEAFYNGVGDRSKVVFYQTNGLHYEAP